MRELDLEPHTEALAHAPDADHAVGSESAASAAQPGRSSGLDICVIGPGRAGTTIAAALQTAGHAVTGPISRGQLVPADCDAILVCVPDSKIAEVVAGLPAGPLVGHCCGAHGTELLGDRRGFCLHPLMTLSGHPEDLQGAWAAIDGTDAKSLEVARSLAVDMGLTPARISAENRGSYHAAAAIASNFLVALEASAERVAESAGLPRAALVPLVSQTVANWAANGARASLTGPIARGDTATVERHRSAVGSCAPDLLDMFDALRAATESLARPEAAA